MSDSTILYAGVFCFTMTLLGLALTIFEFRRVARLRDRSIRGSAEKSATVRSAQFAAGRRA